MVSNALLFLTTLISPASSETCSCDSQLRCAKPINLSACYIKHNTQKTSRKGIHFFKGKEKNNACFTASEYKMQYRQSKVDKADSFQKCKPVTTASRNHMPISKDITPHEISFWDVSKKYKISKKS